MSKLNYLKKADTLDEDFGSVEIDESSRKSSSFVENYNAYYNDVKHKVSEDW